MKQDSEKIFHLGIESLERKNRITIENIVIIGTKITIPEEVVDSINREAADKASEVAVIFMLHPELFTVEGVEAGVILEEAGEEDSKIMAEEGFKTLA